MCHALLQDPKLFLLLLHADEELATATQVRRCPCGGVLHRANYPRKPRGCPNEVLDSFVFRFSFCCDRCRKRTTSMSVRFLGRRVYLGLLVVLMSSRLNGPTSVTTQLSKTLGVPLRTLQRWRLWWIELFPLTPLWQAACARFMPSVETSQLPSSLMERFAGSAGESMVRLLFFLTPLTVGRPVTLQEGR